MVKSAEMQCLFENAKIIFDMVMRLATILFISSILTVIATLVIFILYSTTVSSAYNDGKDQSKFLTANIYFYIANGLLLLNVVLFITTFMLNKKKYSDAGVRSINLASKISKM